MNWRAVDVRVALRNTLPPAGARAGVSPRTLRLFAAAVAMAAQHGGAADAEDFLQYRWYRLELVVFEQSPVLAAREGFSEDGVAARKRLLDTVRYPYRAFALAEAPATSDGEVRFGPPPSVDTSLPLVVSNLLPPAWFTGPCAAEHWAPPLPRWIHPFESPRPTPADPCLPPDPWVVERAGFVHGMHQIVPGPAGFEQQLPDIPTPENEPAEPDRRQAVRDGLAAAFAEFETELLRTSYEWKRDTPLFAAERQILARHYDIIAAGGWHQPVPPRDEPQPLLVQLGTPDETRRLPLEGWLSVTLGRFVHLRVVLEYQLPDDRVALFAEQRRMRTDEPHYLDHPAIGILARVDPLPLPEDLGLLLDELEEIDE
ncbi:MAG: hypothetical protein F4089_04635 [Gammaproteobacteria bacterium]|nr:hypothetical protein [Gammaproteobacteria bacterium]